MQFLCERKKVEDWLSMQPSETDAAVGVDKLELGLEKSWTTADLKHFRTLDKFTVSEAGAIGIVTIRSLAVFDPNTHRLVSLPTRRSYHSAVFLKLSRKEHLVASCTDDGSIHLWDIGRRSHRVVYKQRSAKPKDMLLCVINGSTVAHGEACASANGPCKVYLLNMETKKWSVRSILLLKGITYIEDMCCMMTNDGVSCLVLACTDDRCVRAVEIISGKVRWQIGLQQLGNPTYPYSMCTNSDNNVFIADYAGVNLHMCSAEDGSVLTSINLSQFGFLRPFCVRAHKDNVYVGHLGRVTMEALITKFKYHNMLDH